MTDGEHDIIRLLLDEYDIQTAGGIQDVLKEMMVAKMEEHLGYEKLEHFDNDDFCNGYKKNALTIAMYLWKLMWLRTENQLLQSAYDRHVYGLETLTRPDNARPIITLLTGLCWYRQRWMSRIYYP